MSRTSFKNIKRMFIVSLIAGAATLGVASLSKFDKVKASDEPIYNYDDVSTYVNNEYDSYVSEKTTYHNEKYSGKTLYPESLKNEIDAFNYYLGGTTVEYNGETVVIKSIISNGYLFEEIAGVTNKVSYDEKYYSIVNIESIDKTKGISLDLIESKTVIIEQLNSDGSYTYYRENSKLDNMQDIVYDEMLLQKDEGMVTWKINVPTAGFYNLELNYYPIEGNSSNIERSLAINGVVPFDGADTFSFSRIWKDKDSSYEIDEDGNKVLKTDVSGNDIKPKQVENPQLVSSYFKDDMGYVNEPYMFYLDEGDNYITLVSVKEPVLIDSISVLEVQKNISYKEYLASFENIENKITNQSVKLQAENTLSKSSPTLYPTTDRSSSKTYPFSYTVTKLNVIGGTSWQVLGDWISWEFSVPETGFYNISMRAKQNMVRGMYSSRKVYINDEILFDELNDVQFKYKNNFQIVTLGNDEEDFLFYFEKGKTYTIKMEVTLGQYAPLIEDLQVCIDDLSRIYRMIIAHTTVTPESGTDYQLIKNFPTLKDDLTRNRDELVRISDEISAISGGKSDKTGVIDNVVVQLNDFLKNNNSIEQIPTRLSTFSNNISSLGTLLNTLRELPLQLDYIQIHTPDVKLERANENIFRRVWDSVVSFVLSFFLDYSSISATEDSNVDSDEVVNIDVWMTLGRDQANVIRSLIDTSFSKEYPNIKVELKLTASDVLLKATLAGIGPDVALNVDSTLPVNYALRNAVMDLSERIYEYEYVVEQDKNGEYILTSSHLPKLSDEYYEDENGNKVIQVGYILEEDMLTPSGSKLPTLADLQIFMNNTYPTYFDVLRDEIKTANPNATDNDIETLVVNRLKTGVEIKKGMVIPTYLYDLYPSLFTVLRNVDNSKIETKLVKDQDFLMLSQETDFDSFWKNTSTYQYASNVYMESSLRQFQFNYQYDKENGYKEGYGTYALPEKQIFLMMFVRDDIMEELGLSDMIPETWDDMIDLIAELQTSQLQFYLPVNSEGATALNPIFVSKLYQLGGQLYADDNKSTGLKSDAAMTAFEEWTDYYTLYSFPKAANFTNRFRSGEQPIGIAYYELYNTLSVFAPELKGRWSFYQIPGTRKTVDLVDDNGNLTGETVTYVDHTATASGTGCVMMRQPNSVSKKDAEKTMDAAWEFMKWWSSAETQTSFGREMEGILGSAARHTTANVKALQQLAWKKSDLTILMKQWSEVHEMPQIAGSYITGREVENAYRQVINNGYNPREVLYEYAGKIDVEIDRKRTEFGLELE